MNELFTRTIEENFTNLLAQFPDELLTEEEREITDFILLYAREHEKTPSVKRVMEDFSTFIPFKWESSKWETDPPPFGDVFKQTVQRKLLAFSERKLKEVQFGIRKDGVVSYSSFDRSLYLRRSSMNLPFNIINRHIGGISNGDFMLIVGRLGTGKSTVAQHIAKRTWEEGKRILFVSAEMLGVDVFSRIDAMVGGFNPLDLRSVDGTVSSKLEKVLATVYKKAKDALGEIIVPRTRLLTPQQIASFAKNLAVDLIIVDGAYLLQPSGGGYTSKWEKVATVSNELKQVALDLNLPMVATAQIKRGADGSDGYDPEDIALSDSLGQDSDFVIAIYPNKTIKGRAELQLIKNRYGSTCATQIFVNHDTMEVIDETIVGAVDVIPTLETVAWGKW